MKLTKIDLLNMRLPRAWRGYDRQEVDRLLADAAEVIGQLSEDKHELSRKVDELTASLSEHKQREQTLRDTLMTTQKMIEGLKANARKESQLIIEQAQTKAEGVLQRAHQRLAQLHDDITELKRQRTQFEVKLKSLLDAHQRLLEMDAQEQEELENMEAKLSYMKKAK